MPVVLGRRVGVHADGHSDLTRELPSPRGLRYCSHALTGAFSTRPPEAVTGCMHAHLLLNISYLTAHNRRLCSKEQLQARLLALEDVLVELLLQPLVGQVDAQLLKAVLLRCANTVPSVHRRQSYGAYAANDMHPAGARMPICFAGALMTWLQRRLAGLQKHHVQVKTTAPSTQHRRPVMCCNLPGTTQSRRCPGCRSCACCGGRSPAR